jgi:hypothetical protein
MAVHGGRIDARNLPGAAPDAPPAGLEMRLWWPDAAAASGADHGTAFSPG